MLLAHGITRVVTFVASLVLARLLEPADFGVVATALLVMTGVGTLTGFGLFGVVVTARKDARLFETTLTLLLVGGVLGAGAVISTSGQLAELFDSPPLGTVLSVLSATLVIAALTGFYEAMFQRELRFRGLLLTQLVRAVVYTAVAIGAAAGGAGVWSLVAGQLAAAVAYAVALLATAPYVVIPGFSLARARGAVRSGRGFLGQTVITVVQHNADVGAIAYMNGTRAAGYYSMAWSVATVPYNAFTVPVTSAAFPVVAASHRREEPTSELGLQLLAVLALFVCPAGILVSAGAEPLVGSLLGEKWQPAAAALTVLGLWVAVVQVEAALGWFLNAIGRAGTNAAISAAVTLPLLPALFVGANAGGIAGVAWVMLASAALAAVAMMLAVRSYGGLSLSRQLGTLRPVALGCGVAWVIARLTVDAASGAADGVALLAGVAAGSLAYTATIRLLWPATLSQGAAFVAAVLSELRQKR